MHTINRQQLQVLTNRMTKKDTAKYLDISTSTLRRWEKSDKPPKTKKDHTKSLKNFKEKYGKTRTKKTLKQKRRFKKRNKNELFKTHVSCENEIIYEKFGTRHEICEVSKIDSKVVFNLFYEKANEKIEQGFEHAGGMIKLFGKITRANERINDYVSTDLWAIIHKNNILSSNILAIIKDAFNKLYSKYEINNVTKIHCIIQSKI